MRCRAGVRITGYVLMALALAAAPRLALAQTAQLAGFITDESGASVERAAIRIVNDATGQARETKTNASGQYVATTLANGRYTVTVTAQGFRPATRAVLIDVAQVARLDVTLAVGDMNETVDVSVEAQPLQSTDGAVSTVIDRRFITSLPLNGRTLQSLISLVPGVVAVPATFGSTGQFSVNGQRADANGFSVDGVSAAVSATGGGFGEDFTGTHPTLSAAGTTSNLVSLDALQEFRVQTSSFAPEYGRTPGAQIQLITRSGANRMTGAASYYFRHDAMDANDWFANRAQLPKAKLRHNDIGGVLGGPLRRDRLFYFFSHETLDQTLPQAIVGQVPSLATRASAAPGLQGMLNAFPLPNGPDSVSPTTGQPTGLASFTSNHSDTTDVHSTGLRVDAALTSSWSFFGRGQFAPSSSFRRRGASSWVQTIEQDGLTVTGGANATLGASTALELRGNYSRSTYVLDSDVDSWGGAGPVDRGLLFPPGAGNGLGDFILVLGGLQRLMVGAGVDNTQHQVNLVGSIARVAGSHLFKAGVDYRRLRPELDAVERQLQMLVLSTADLAAGTVYIYRSLRQPVRPQFQNVSIFGQDNWTMNDRLTLTYGVRWDINPPFSMLEGDYPVTLRGATAATGLTLAPPGTRPYDTVYGNVAPRVGFSLRMADKADWSTLVKGGGGLFFDIGSQGTDFVGHPNLLNAFVGPYRLPLSPEQTAPLTPIADPYSPPFNGLVSGYDANYATPRSWQWNLGVVQGLGRAQSLSLTYVGSSGRHLLRRQRLDAGADFPGSVLISYSDAASSYHAVSAQFTRRMSRGLQALASYTWSHAIDDTSALLVESVDRASASFDVRQAGSLAVAYELPSGGSGLLRALSSGWAIDGTARFRTGLPVDVVIGSETVATEILVTRPDRIDAPFYTDTATAPGGRRFNIDPNASRDGCLGAACTPAGSAGDMGRNVFRGLGAWQIDLALRRSIPIGGAARVTVSAEIFNVLNHPNFGQPDGSFSSPDYGLATSMLNRSLGGLDPLYQIGGPRSIQLGAKVTF